MIILKNINSNLHFKIKILKMRKINKMPNKNFSLNKNFNKYCKIIKLNLLNLFKIIKIN